MGDHVVFECHGERLRLSRTAAVHCGLVREALEPDYGDCGALEPAEEPVFPLPPQVGLGAARLLVEFLVHNEASPMPAIDSPLRSRDIADAVPEWYAAFAGRMDRAALYEAVLAADLLDARGLMDLCCAKLAIAVIGKSPQQIREEFGVENDTLPAEVEALAAEGRWRRAAPGAPGAPAGWERARP
jgi:hypothetical protein